MGWWWWWYLRFSLSTQWLGLASEKQKKKFIDKSTQGWEQGEKRMRREVSDCVAATSYCRCLALPMMMMMVYLFSTVNALYIVSRLGWMLSLLKAARGGGKMVWRASTTQDKVYLSRADIHSLLIFLFCLFQHFISFTAHNEWMNRASRAGVE